MLLNVEIKTHIELYVDGALPRMPVIVLSLLGVIIPATGSDPCVLFGQREACLSFGHEGESQLNCQTGSIVESRQKHSKL